MNNSPLTASELAPETRPLDLRATRTVQSGAEQPDTEQSAAPQAAAPQKIRYHQVDALRGLAVAGIIFANLPAILNIFSAEVASDQRLQAITEYLVSNKFYSIFGFLFGVSMALYLGTLKGDGRAKTWQVVRRMVILYAFGFLHSYGYGSDVLRSYAAVGLVLPLAVFIPKPWDRALPIAGALLMLVHPPMGFMVIGFWLTRNGIFQSLLANTERLTYALVASIAAIVPISAGYVYVTSSLETASESEQGLLLTAMMPLSVLSVIVLVIAYSALVLRATRNADAWVTRVLAPYGRMALTNYISQTVLTIVVGHALGVYGARDWSLALGLCVSIIAVQMVFSYFWMRTFRYGPLEWVWRAGTRLELPPPHAKVVSAPGRPSLSIR
nr:DUF418 domain-containing protein [Corynebacterium lactis]